MLKAEHSIRKGKAWKLQESIWYFTTIILTLKNDCFRKHKLMLLVKPMLLWEASREKPTVDKHNRLLDGVLVTELRVHKSPTDERAVWGWLIPAHVKVIDVDMAQTSHHLHLIMNYKRKQIKPRISVQEPVCRSEERFACWLLFGYVELFIWRIDHSDCKQEKENENIHHKWNRIFAASTSV